MSPKQMPILFGRLEGELAQNTFRGGVNVSTANFIENIRFKKQYLKEQDPICEGSWFYRADILKP